MPRNPIVLLLLLASLPTTRLAAQATNVEILSSLAVACVSEVSTSHASIALTGPDRLPFIRSAVLARLRSRNVRILEAGTPDVARLDVDLHDAGISYSRARGGNVRRAARLSVAIRMVDPVGVVLHDAPCSRHAEDVVARDAIPGLEDATYPETRAEIPLSLWKRAVQPAIVTVATVAGTILFFSLRSRRSESG